MNSLLKLVTAFVLGCVAVTAIAQTSQLQTQTLTLPYQQPGPRLIDGAVVNGLIVRTQNGMCVTGGGTVDTAVFIAPSPMMLTSISAVYSTAAGAAFTLQLTKATGTQSVTAGAALMTGTFNLNSTINTVVNGTLVASSATKTFAAGDRLGFDFTGTPTNSAGLNVTSCFMPLAQ